MFSIHVRCHEMIEGCSGSSVAEKKDIEKQNKTFHTVFFLLLKHFNTFCTSITFSKLSLGVTGQKVVMIICFIFGDEMKLCSSLKCTNNPLFNGLVIIMQCRNSF